jgi:hypothetical protein
MIYTHTQARSHNIPEIGAANWKVSAMALSNEKVYVNMGPEMLR